MEYLGDDAVRFSDCDNDALRARAVVEVSRLFFSALRDVGLVHGDISPTNVLIRGDGRPGLVDFGCCLTLPDGGKHILQTREEVEGDSQTERDTAFGMQLWDRREWPDKWAERLERVDVTSLQLGGERATIPGLALILRSIFALTILAKQVPPAILRLEEVAWKRRNPEAAAIQDQRRRMRTVNKQ